MCGIFGLVRTKESFEKHKVKSLVDDLLLLSESRGKDSSGVAFVKEEEIIVYKEPLPAHKFISKDKYKKLFEDDIERYALIGHARMETNGSYSLSYNNQPVIKDGIVTIHNGIIVNDEQIWKGNKSLKREYQVDTEVFNSLLRKNIEADKNFLNGLKATLKEIKGSYAFACFFEDFDKLLLVTNTGSLFTITNKAKAYLIFVSEKHFAEEIVKKHFSSDETTEIKQVKAGTGAIIDINSLETKVFSLDKKPALEDFRKRKVKRKIVEIGETITEIPIPEHILKNRKKFKEVERLILDEYKQDKEAVKRLRRCARCIVPETMPFIEFDEDGVCSLCRDYQRREVKGVKELEKLVSKFRKGNGEADCIVSFSGGRDSCYALHYAVKELGLKPLA